MNTIRLKITGMHCESCEKVLKKNLLRVENIKDINLRYNNEIATIMYENVIDANRVIDVIRTAGYDATVMNGDSINETMNFRRYLEDIKQSNRLEREVILIAIGILISLVLLELIAYFGFFKNIPDFFSKYGYYIIFLIISVVITGASIWHAKAYGNRFSCMTGMMIGMTTGMISGFLIGILIGATNGMFIGSVAGILVGMSVGIWTGNCCGAMGTMEGMMAGLMGGLMGAMTSLMLLNDNLKLIIPILVLASLIILIGLDYTIYKEARNAKFNKYEYFPYITFCFIITIALTFLMVYGPKSALFG